MLAAIAHLPDKLPLPTLRTSADARDAADDMGERIIVSRLYNQSECLLPLPTRRTSADGIAVVDDIRQHIIVLHP